jgi:hypothetical protein
VKVVTSILDGFLDRVLEAADRILNLASDLLRLAFGFELGVAGHFARNFLDLAFSLLDGALDSIFVHVFLSLLGSTFSRRHSTSTGGRGKCDYQKITQHALPPSVEARICFNDCVQAVPLIWSPL